MVSEGDLRGIEALWTLTRFKGLWIKGGLYVKSVFFLSKGTEMEIR